MRLSIAFTGFTPLEPTVAAVRAAEGAGFDGVWVAEHVGFHDAVVPATVYLRETRRLEVGLVGLAPVTRHPGITAMELVSLSELAPGRVRVAIGTGDPGLIGTLGKTMRKPLGSVSAFVASLREAMRGSPLEVEHEEFAFRGFRLVPFGPPVPIDVMAIRPKMTKLAAREGDGLSISIGASREYIRNAVRAVERELAAAGRKRSDFRITALAFGVVADDLEAGVQPVREILAMFPPELVEALATGVVEPGSLDEAAKRGPAALMKAWTRKMIEAIALVATPDGLGRALREYADTGIDELGLILAADAPEQPAIVRKIAAVRP